MIEESALGEGWTVWNADESRAILAYRPDVFDGSTFPAPCLPTIYVTRGRRRRRPEGNRNLPADAPWLVRLRLEPEIDRDPEAYDTRTAAIEAATGLTERFAAGGIDYRSLYQVPRGEYLEKLDELTGRP
ncbi:hypothetical protein KM295_02945 [Natronomonas sp. F2-12]|uniref:Uncharacterized protein n=1 Tax=Natronomonas aquatica TaxID=2841590 RepID=A0A9R1D5L1_9EURY|nr:DUF5820 family protein [Natronomonas aquatica]MCQ4332458.1 hypothetical protein [Natronomonas aquatica]